MNVFIIARDLYSHVRRTVDWVRLVGGVPVVIDNASTYGPLLDWYATEPCEIIRLETNVGKLSPWVSGAVARSDGPYYAVTDPDLDFSGIPGDVLTCLQHALEARRGVVKAGVSLSLADLPANALGAAVASWEGRWWQTRDDDCWQAAVDTTLCVCSHERPFPLGATGPAVRLDRPYTARHLPWYPETTDTDEFRYYLERADASGNHWTAAMRRERGSV